jgi:GntR family transcriptional regulator
MNKPRVAIDPPFSYLIKSASKLTLIIIPFRPIIDLQLDGTSLASTFLTHKNMINRDSVLPLYYQLAQILRGQIRSKEILAGEKLPSERNLMKFYRLSRNTVRQAIDLLVQEGLVYQDHGRGNFTIGTGLNIQYRIDTFIEHNEFLRRVGNTPSVKAIKTETILAPETVRKALRLSQEDEVVSFTKLFSSNGEPAILAVDFIPCNLLGNHYDPAGSGEAFFQLLEEINGKSVKFTLSDIVPISAPPDVAAHLQLPVGTSILLLQETFLDPGKNNPLAFAHSYYHPNIHFRILRRRS